ncbi:MAG: hypothetical protein MJZ33_00420 [Paludibacteraceae bacterium]|nr:hypothetical protein [Paludibacteraceae bacterium]
MKPTKNKNFCYGAKRTKMLFETQAKADNFIKYNSAEMLETVKKAPVRSYYCQFCMGWHVTSNPNLEVGAELDQREQAAIDFIRKYSESEKMVRKQKKAEKPAMKSEREEKKERICWLVKMEICLLKYDYCTLENLFKEYEELYGEAKGIDGVKERYEEVCHAYSELQKVNEDSEYEPTLPPKYMVLAERIKLKKWLNLKLLDLMQFAESGDEQYEEQLRVFKKDVEQSELIHTKARKAINKEISKYNAAYKQKHPEYVEQMILTKKRGKGIKRKETYKKNLLEVIYTIESMEVNFNEGNVQKCKDDIKLCLGKLDELRLENSSTVLLRRHLSQWTEKIGETMA